MLFKDISFLELWRPFDQRTRTIMCNFGRRYHEEQFCDIILNLDQKEMLFKGISYLKLWQPFCSAKCNSLCNFGRGYYEEQFCEIILNLGQWFRRCHLGFLICSSGGPPVCWSGTIYALLKEGIMGNIHAKLYEIWTSRSEGEVV